ncbi:MAG: DUF1080 domain-containing protein [Pirellulaceae bacterium]
MKNARGTLVHSKRLALAVICTSLFFAHVLSSWLCAQETQGLTSPALGTWAFELPDGYPAWLGVESTEDGIGASLLWSVGSAREVNDLQVNGSNLKFQRKLKWRFRGTEELKSEIREITSPFHGKVVGDTLELEFNFRTASAGGEGPLSASGAKGETLKLMGKRMPPLPPKPDLSRVTFGKPIELFDGKSLAGWHLANSRAENGWRAEGGELVNETPKTDFSAYGQFGNLVTDRKFDDFRLTIEYNVEAHANSGIYLRGMYEAQVVDRDSRMQGIAGPGAIFGRIEPTENAGRPGGDWNRYVLTLVNRHVTVELNGTKVVDNAGLIGCTGGGLSADDTQAGPIFLQGDHTSVRYRNIVLEPVVGRR